MAPVPSAAAPAAMAPAHWPRPPPRHPPRRRPRSPPSGPAPRPAGAPASSAGKEPSRGSLRSGRGLVAPLTTFVGRTEAVQEVAAPAPRLPAGDGDRPGRRGQDAAGHRGGPAAGGPVRRRGVPGRAGRACPPALVPAAVAAALGIHAGARGLSADRNRWPRPCTGCRCCWSWTTASTWSRRSPTCASCCCPSRTTRGSWPPARNRSGRAGRPGTGWPRCRCRGPASRPRQPNRRRCACSPTGPGG